MIEKNEGKKLRVGKNVLSLRSKKRGPDGGIGRRVGLKHQWGKLPCRFETGSGYQKLKPLLLRNNIICRQDFVVVSQMVK